MGMQDATAQEFETHDPKTRTVLSVSRRSGNCMASKELKDGDILLRLGGNMVNSFRELEKAVAGKETVQVPFNAATATLLLIHAVST